MHRGNLTPKKEHRGKKKGTRPPGDVAKGKVKPKFMGKETADKKTLIPVSRKKGWRDTDRWVW